MPGSVKSEIPSPQGQFVHYKNGKIHYAEQGKGRTIVLLHGFLESTQVWKHWAPNLAGGYRVICIDLPGHGKSDCFGYVHPMELQADAVKTVLTELGIRKCLVVGHSMGGYVALALAEAYPDMLKGLILLHSTAAADSPQRKAGREQAIRLVKENHRSFIRKAIPMLFRPKNRTIFREKIKELKKEALLTPPQGIVASLEGMKIRVNRELVVRFTPCPVLYITGKQDPIITVEKIEQEALLAEKPQPEIIPDCGHMSFIEAPETGIKLIRKFVRDNL